MKKQHYCKCCRSRYHSALFDTRYYCGCGCGIGYGWCWCCCGIGCGCNIGCGCCYGDSGGDSACVRTGQMMDLS